MPTKQLAEVKTDWWLLRQFRHAPNGRLLDFLRKLILARLLVP
jgi:hypothetical protein